MKMFVTVCGISRILGKEGDPHGWPATAYETVEKWMKENLKNKYNMINPEEAEDNIIQKIYEILLEANINKIKKIISV